jgi:hypothetical protein
LRHFLIPPHQETPQPPILAHITRISGLLQREKQTLLFKEKQAAGKEAL